MFLAMLVLCSAMLGYEINTQGIVIPDDKDQKFAQPGEFNFMVFCPISYGNQTLDLREDKNEDLRRRLLMQSYSDRVEVDK